MVTAYNFEKAHQVIEEAKRIAASEMPNGVFSLVGIDNTYVYFKVACRLYQTTSDQMRDIIAKTRFEVINIRNQIVYSGEFKIKINL